MSIDRTQGDVSWNFADVWSAVARRYPDDPAILHEDRSISWSDFHARSSGLAGAISGHSEHQDRVAIMLRNGPEYLETMYACLLSATVPVNTNYRYSAPELAYLWDNADATVVVFAQEFVDECAAVRESLPPMRLWIYVGEREACPGWAMPYEEAFKSAGASSTRVRSGDDLIMQYTGGTTGKPKGVMWRQDDLFRMLEQANGSDLSGIESPDDFVSKVGRPSVRVLPAAPLMHGTALWFSLPPLSRGGAVVTLSDRKYDPGRLLDAVERHSVRSVAVVGDVFVKPLLDALDAEPHRWDLSSLRIVFSSGVMFSRESKQRLVEHLPRARIIDNLGSQESGAAGLSSSSAGEINDTSTFHPGPGTRVVAEDGTEVVAGSGHTGRIALAGYLPLGYHKDPEKTAATFVEIDGVRHVIPGDWAEVLVDGRLRLVGRGSQCINTGGEKVFPEEVEEVLKSIPGITDAAVIGIPDERFGEKVIAVAAAPPGDRPDTSEVIARARQELAGYKLPKEIVWRVDLGRGPNGKLDYPALRESAVALLNEEDEP